MSIRPKLSKIVASQLPEFIREDYPTFVAFLEAYYEHLEQTDINLYDARDIDNSLDNFIQYFRDEVAPTGDIRNITGDSNAIDIDQRFFLSRIKDAHLAKGSEASFKLLFRILFNKNVAIGYPSQQMLRASDGKWNQDVSVFVRINQGEPLDVIGKSVTVSTLSRPLKIQIERVEGVPINIGGAQQLSPDTFQFFIDRRFFGTLEVGDRIRYGSTFDGTIVATTTKVEVVKPGKNFRPGQLYAVNTATGRGSVMKVSRIHPDGGIKNAEFVQFGIGYTSEFTTSLAARIGYSITGVGQTAGYSGVVPSAVTRIDIVNGGSGYLTPPTVTVFGGNPYIPATVGKVTIVGGVITSITVATTGEGYEEAPSINIFPNPGGAAQAVAILGNAYDTQLNDSTEGFEEQGVVYQGEYTSDVEYEWGQGITVVLGEQLYFGGNLYEVTVSGTTGATAPVHTAGSMANGTATLMYLREYADAWQSDYAGGILRTFSSSDVLPPPDMVDFAVLRISVGALAKYPGYYKNNDGFLDDAMFIQDSRYYQAYSYVLKIDEKLSAYKSFVKTLTHPAGTAMFGDYEIRNDVDINVALRSMVERMIITAYDQFSVDAEIAFKDVTKLHLDSFTFTHHLAKDVTKPDLADSFALPDAVAKTPGKVFVDDIDTPYDAIDYKDVGKNVIDQVSFPELLDILIKDSTKLLTTDLTVTETTRYDLAKYTSDSFSHTDGGNIFYNPYVADPYPSVYWGSDYTVGETSF